MTSGVRFPSHGSIRRPKAERMAPFRIGGCSSGWRAWALEDVKTGRERKFRFEAPDRPFRTFTSEAFISQRKPILPVWHRPHAATSDLSKRANSRPKAGWSR